jgi:hypothetical protein
LVRREEVSGLLIVEQLPGNEPFQKLSDHDKLDIGLTDRGLDATTLSFFSIGLIKMFCFSPSDRLQNRNLVVAEQSYFNRFKCASARSNAKHILNFYSP